MADNKQVILEFWAVDPAEKHRYFTDDVVWHLPSSVAVSAERTWTIDHVVGEDDLVALHCTMDGSTVSGNEYHNSYHFLFRLDDGRIAEGWEFLDTAYAFERIGPKLPEG